MEGFVHQTKTQRLEAIAKSLRTVYAGRPNNSAKLFEDQLRRLDEAERSADRPDEVK